MRFPRWWTLALLAACNADVDGDGFAKDIDCDDADPTVYPGANEVCDGADDDCNGVVDDYAADARDWYVDDDADGYGVSGRLIEACDQPAGAASGGGDCDDTRPEVHPGAAETCNGIDDDCDDETDEGAADAPTWYTDGDGDGAGDPATATLACAAPAGAVEASGDCDDNDASLNTRDQDGDGSTTCAGDCHDNNPFLNGLDGDADGYSTCDQDCDDADPALTPGDFDGDGNTSCAGDCDDTDPLVDGLDADGDGWSICDGDCDDASVALQPEDADGDGDSSCDGDCDDDVGGLNLHDTDTDGFTTCDGDCNDFDPALTPADADFDYSSTCDGDCDDNDPTVEGRDVDGDGVDTCGGDCDDADGLRFPGNPERCNGADEDCDGVPDDDPIDDRYWYYDGDGDGFGVTATAVLACAAPTVDHVPLGEDCNDGAQAINPGMAEDCLDGIDNDCSGVIDDCGPPGPTPAGDAEGQWWGTGSGAAATSLAVLDLNADGAAEVAVGAPSTGQGRVWLIHGGPSLPAAGGLNTSAQAILDSTLAFQFGSFMASLGDLDADGYPDLGVVAPSGDGRVFVLWGGPTLPTGALTDAADTTLQFLGRQNNFGPGLTGIGDIDGDGDGDAAVAAYNESFGASQGGVVYLMQGEVGRPAPYDYFTMPRIEGGVNDQICAGRRCIAAGDLDADGLSDVAIGSYHEGVGDVWFSYGEPVTPPSVSTDALPSLHNPLAYGQGTFGNAMDTLDYDGDGYEDLAVGDVAASLYGSAGGAVYLFRGGAVRFSGVGDGADPFLTVDGTEAPGMGYALAGVPDVDGDGRDELAVGEPWSTGAAPDSGAVWVFTGELTGGVLTNDDAFWSLGGDVVWGAFGASIETGDVTGDGAVDLVVGAPDAGSQAGRVYVFTSWY